MIILGVDASGPECSVALRRDGALVCERFRGSSRGHGGTLLHEVHSLLSEAQIALEEVDLFVASSGPGAFTGVRVGLATVTALAWALKKPVTAVDTLSALALNGRSSGDWVSPVLDARKSEVYGALFRWDEGGLDCVLPASVMPPDRWQERVAREALERPVRFLGTGVQAYPDSFPPSSLDPRVHAAALTALAEDLWQRHGPTGLPPAVPRYVRPSEAEIKFGPAPEHDPVRAANEHG